jgi:transcription factor IIIB subunit 2
MMILLMVEKQTGRKPGGICGAALYMAALAHGFTCSKSDIVS